MGVDKMNIAHIIRQTDRQDKSVLFGCSDKEHKARFACGFSRAGRAFLRLQAVTTHSFKEDKTMKPKRKIISLLLCAAMLLSFCPTSVFAEAAAQDSGISIGASGFCEHHPAHNESCGYRTPEELFDEFLDSVYAAEGCGSIAQDGSQRLPS